MSQSPETPDGGAAPQGQAPPGWPAADAGWPAAGQQSTPDWAAAPAWGQPTAAPAAPPVPSAQSGRGRWVVAGAALAGLAAGAVGATFLVSAVFIGSAEDIGRAMAQELGPGIAEGVRDGMVEGNQESMDALMGGMLDDESMGWYAGGSSEDVEQFPPVEPEGLGPDAELDAYAQGCFEGDLQACDDLMYDSPPLSAYEEYASTCGGRVKKFSVPVCTELE